MFPTIPVFKNKIKRSSWFDLTKYKIKVEKNECYQIWDSHIPVPLYKMTPPYCELLDLGPLRLFLTWAATGARDTDFMSKERSIQLLELEPRRWLQSSATGENSLVTPEMEAVLSSLPHPLTFNISKLRVKVIYLYPKAHRLADASNTLKNTFATNVWTSFVNECINLYKYK